MDSSAHHDEHWTVLRWRRCCWQAYVIMLVRMRRMTSWIRFRRVDSQCLVQWFTASVWVEQWNVSHQSVCYNRSPLFSIRPSFKRSILACIKLICFLAHLAKNFFASKEKRYSHAASVRFSVNDAVQILLIFSFAFSVLERSLLLICQILNLINDSSIICYLIMIG